MKVGAAVLSALIFASPAMGLEINLPAAARPTAEVINQLSSVAIPLASFDGRGVPSVAIEGQIVRRAWKIGTGGLTPLQVLDPIREQIRAAGYRIVLDCESAACGGFDFRFAVDVLPGPNMYVNIRSYRYLTALSGSIDAPKDAVTVLVSTAAAAAYVQVTTARAQSGPVPSAGPEAREEPATGSTQSVPTRSPRDLKTALIETGSAVLGDLEFETGSAELGARPYGSLTALAALLVERPTLQVALVGHTDSVGSLDANIALSRLRARAVRQRLISAHDVNPNRMEAEGMGYLAPRASNLTADGRDANRRVEVILLSQE